MTKIWPASHEEYDPFDNKPQHRSFSTHEEIFHTVSRLKDVWLRDDEDYVDDNFRAEWVSKTLELPIISDSQTQGEGLFYFHDGLHGTNSMNAHFEWAMLCLSGEKQTLPQLPAVDLTNVSKRKSNYKKQKLPKKKKKKGKTKKTKKAKKKTVKRQKPGKKPAKKRPCPCKKVPGWNGVFARSSHNGTKKYFILISLRGKKTYKGSYDTELDCALAYDELIVRERGLENVIGRLNFPEQWGVYPNMLTF